MFLNQFFYFYRYDDKNKFENKIGYLIKDSRKLIKMENKFRCWAALRKCQIYRSSGRRRSPYSVRYRYNFQFNRCIIKQFLIHMFKYHCINKYEIYEPPYDNHIFLPYYDQGSLIVCKCYNFTNEDKRFSIQFYTYKDFVKNYFEVHPFNLSITNDFIKYVNFHSSLIEKCYVCIIKNNLNFDSLIRDLQNSINSIKSFI